MRNLFPASIRSKLILLGGLAFIPVVLGLVSHFLGMRKMEVEQSKARMERILSAAVRHEEDTIRETHRILATLAEVPAVLEGGHRANEYLARFLKASPEYTTFGVSRPDGQVIASAVPLKTPTNLSDRSYFQDALRNRSFSVGNYIVGRIAGKPVLPFAYPAIDRRGKVVAVLFAGIDLSHITRFEAEVGVQTPKDSYYVKLDRNGAVLTSYPETQVFGQGHLLEKPLFERISKERKGTFKATGMDGVERLYIFSPLFRLIEKEEAYVLLGIPTQAIFAGANRMLAVSLTVLSVVMVFFLGILWFGGNVLIVRPVRVLTETSRRLASGDLTARSGLHTAADEIGQLSRTFDEMAVELERRKEKLSKVQARLAHILATNPTIVYACRIPEGDESGKGYPPVFVSDKITDLFGYDPEEILGNPAWWPENIHPEDQAAATAPGTLFDHGRMSKEYRFRSRDGSYRWVLDQLVLVRDGKGPPAEIVGSWIDITEQKKREQELEESEDRYRDLVEHSHDLICTHDLEGRILSVNPWAATALGYAPDELLQMNLRDLLAPRFRQEFDAYLDEVGKHGIAQGLILVRTRAGEDRVWEYNNTLRTDGVTKPIVRGMAHDVTERKQAEDALRRNRNMLAHILDSIPQSVYWKDRDSVYLGCNKVFARQAGIDNPDEIAGKTDFDLPWSREESEAYRADDREVMENDRPKLHVTETRHQADGSRIWLDTTKVPLKNETGRVYGVLGVYEDITERMQAQEALTRLGMAVEQTVEAIIVTDTEARIEYVNPAFEHITGYPREEAIGQNVRILKSGKQDEMFYKTMWKTILRGEVWTGRLINRKKDGTFYEEVATISPIRDDSGRIVNYVAVKRDVTQEVLLQKQLQTAQRMESVGTLAGGIAHDFNNALTGIVGFGELLRMRLSGDEQGLHDLDEILRCAERASTLTRQLLAYARRQTMKPVRLDLGTLVSDLMKLIGKVMGEQIEVKTSLGENVPTIQADRGQIEQVLMNLCLNARDAMPDGGKFLVETGEAVLEEEYVRKNPYMKTGRYALLAVSDTGVGMDEKTRERVFDPFFTTKGPDKGTGLGLAMAYGIVKQHNGFIHLYSEPGKGTAFRVYFPAVEAPPDAVAEPRGEGIVRGGTERILLAEDEEIIREFIERTLKEYGYTVFVARNGEEAVEIFRANDGIALALLDVVMPRKGGREALDQMRNADPRLKAILMSGYSANGIHESFALMAGEPFLQKPFGPTMLARKVREVLDSPD